MINRYYSDELDYLRNIARDFARENPAIAPMLGEPCHDPDVERLLEGVAFLTGAIRQKIDDEFPEIVHDLLRQIWPNMLRPIPATTLIAFAPETKISETQQVKAGAGVDSDPAMGAVCRFTTCMDVDVQPLLITDARYMNPPGQAPWIRICFELSAMTLSGFKPGAIRLHLAGNYPDAANLYRILADHVTDVVFKTDGDENGFRPGPGSLEPAGFTTAEALLPWPTHAFEGFRLIQEYFLLPEKFLFFDLKGMDLWAPSSPSRAFHVDLMLDRTFENGVKCHTDSFMLFVTPAINVFAHTAYPVIADHRKTEYPVTPSETSRDNCQIYSIEKVSGYFENNSEGIRFSEYHGFMPDESPGYYRERISRHPVKDSVSVSVSLAFARGKALPPVKSLSFDVLCTNGPAAEELKECLLGRGRSGIPESIEARNIRKPTVSALPPLGSQALWRLTSLMSMNILSLKRPEDLKALLGLFVVEGHRDRHGVRVNKHRINGIKGFSTRSVDRLIGGTLVRGLDIRITLSRSHFTDMGDVYLFGTVMSRFFGMYASINTFTRLTIDETDSGETLVWPERMGREAL